MKKILHRYLLTVSFFILLGGLAQAMSITAYEVPFETVGNQDFGGSLGMDFDVNADITITSLGVFDSGSNGLSRSITAQIYDRTNTATPLAELFFGIGATGILEGGSRFLALASPLNLNAGFHGTIVASGYGLGESNGNDSTPPTPWTTNAGGGLLSFVGDSRFGTAGSFPGGVDGGPANRYAAGTFQYAAASTSVPEPSVLILMGLGLTGLFACKMGKTEKI